MRKKGDIWISAVLYLGLGVLVLTIILSAGMPLVDKLKDKNVIAQSKNLFAIVDENIRAVTNEGPGSRRFLSPFEIKKGDMYITENRFRWELRTPVKLMEPGLIIKEGALSLSQNETNIVDEYIMNIYTDYDRIAELVLVSEYANPFQGVYSIAIRNTGEYDATSGLPIVDIEVT